MPLLINVILPLMVLAAPFIIIFLILRARRYGNIRYNLALGLALAGVFLLIWMNLAVGLIGDSDNPANLMYAGVLAVGGLGALIAHFEPRGMARALFTMALAQALVTIYALSAGYQPFMGLLVLNGFFVALFAAAGLLFRRTGRGD